VEANHIQESPASPPVETGRVAPKYLIHTMTTPTILCWTSSRL